MIEENGRVQDQMRQLSDKHKRNVERLQQEAAEAKVCPVHCVQHSGP